MRRRGRGVRRRIVTLPSPEESLGYCDFYEGCFMIDSAPSRVLTELDFQVFQQLPGLVSNKLYACTSGMCTDDSTSCQDGTTLPKHCPVQSAQCYAFAPQDPIY